MCVHDSEDDEHDDNGGLRTDGDEHEDAKMPTWAEAVVQSPFPFAPVEIVRYYFVHNMM